MAKRKTGKKGKAPKRKARTPTPEPSPPPPPPSPAPEPEPAQETSVPRQTETPARKISAPSAPKIRGGLRAMWMVKYDNGDVVSYESIRELAHDARDRHGLKFNAETLHALVGRLQRGVRPYASSFRHYKGIKELKRLGPGARGTSLAVPYGTNLLGIQPRVRKPRPAKKSADGDVAAGAAAATETVADTVTPAAPTEPASCHVA